MGVGRLILNMAFVAALAGPAAAASPQAARLPFSLASLGSGPEVTFHPHRWLTIRRSLVEALPDRLHDERAAPLEPLRKVDVLTGVIQPFDDGLRILAGFRHERNRRLLRMSSDPADTATARFIPFVALGIAGELAPGLSVGADIGVLGRAFVDAGGVELVTPIEQGRVHSGDGIRPLAQLSASYRF